MTDPSSQQRDEKQLFNLEVAAINNGGSVSDGAERLYQAMTPEERMQLLHGNTPFWEGRLGIMTYGYNHIPYRMAEVERLGVPGIAFIDGPRGVVVGEATAFPVSMARGATWDPELEEQVGLAIGRELRAAGGNYFGGVCINLPRHPAWGRSQETYSDQTVLLGEMGAALTKGVQRNAIACVKHYALNSMENARFDVDVECDPATMREDYLPHFQKTFAAGALSAMCSYNSINGEWASANRELLTTVLREEWGYQGFVISDFIWAIRDGVESLQAGLDVEAPFAQLRARDLQAALENDPRLWESVHESGMRVLSSLLTFYAQRDKEETHQETIASSEHVALARKVAQESMVLLRNEPVDGKSILPLSPREKDTVTVFGRLADLANTGDAGSSNVEAPYVVTPLEGIRSAFGSAQVQYCDSNDDEVVAREATAASTAIVVVGYTAAEEGEWVNGRIYTREDLLSLYPEPTNEADQKVLDTMLTRAQSAGDKKEQGGDRSSLRLLPEDVALIKKVSANNARTIVVVINAGAVLMSEWDKHVPGLIMMWYSGMEGGNALGDLLSGRVNFAGHLPYAIPTDESHLPYFDASASSITYDRWYGQRKLQGDGNAAAYPLGFGLSYTDYAVHDLTAVQVSPDDVQVRVTAENCGNEPGKVTVQLYGQAETGDRAGERELLGFAHAFLQPGEEREVSLVADMQPLKRWDPENHSFSPAQGAYLLEAATYWGDPAASELTVVL